MPRAFQGLGDEFLVFLAGTSTLAAEDLGIGCPLEFRKAVEALGSRPIRQPVEIAIGPGDVAVRACSYVDDDLSRHVSTQTAVWVDRVAGVNDRMAVFVREKAGQLAGKQPRT